jgi:aryl-alcohol dehydrogenase-like predicted oxidoreductase
MDPITLITFGAALVKAGITTYQQISETIRANRGDLTDEELNAVLEAIAADDDRRAELADKLAE